MKRTPAAADFPTSPASLLTRLIVGTLLVNLFVFALAGLSFRQSYRQYQEQAEIITQNLVDVLEKHIDGTLAKVDVALLAVVDEAGRQLAGGGIDAKALTAHLARQQGRLPELDSLRVASKEGIVSYGRGVVPGSRVDISDRSYFIRQQQNAAAGLVISEPIFARINKKWVLPISRRIDNPDGSFGGIAYAFIALESLSNQFSTLNVGEHGIVTLRDNGLGIVVRHPEPQGVGSVIGQKAAPQPLREMVQAGRNAGTYQALSTVDGIERTFSYRRVSGYPFLIIVGLASDDYLAGWRDDAAKQALLAAAFTLFSLAAAWALYRAVSRQAATSEALREQKDFLDSILENEPECVKVIAPNGALLQMNRAGLAMLEVESIQEAKREGLLSFVHAEHREAFIALGKRIFGGEPGTLEFLVEGKNGTQRWLDTHATPLRGPDGEVYALLAVTRDITARKRAETQLRELNETLEQRVAEAVRTSMEQERLLIQQSRLAALGEMIGNIAHQWRQPLNALALLQANIQDAFEFGELDRASMKLFVDDGQRLIQKMSTTIDDFRDFFKPQREKTEFPLDQAIEHALKIVDASFKDHDITINFAAAEEIRVKGFPNEFSQVLLNLLNNAKDAILERGVREGKIDIACGRDEENIRVTVKDNAGGIPTAILPKIFDPYFTTKEKGTGIGLYMSKMIMDHMDGSIAARNAGDGAELILTLPKA